MSPCRAPSRSGSTSALGVASATTPDTGALGPISVTTVSNEETKPRQGTDYYTRDNDGNLVSLRADGGARYYYLFDGLSSVVGLVDTTAAKVNAYSYDPYGIQLSATQQTPNPFRYAAGHHDGDTSLTKFGARYYHPDHARFTQRDPSGRDLPYAYASCNPVNFADPSGTQSCSDASIALVFGAQGAGGFMEGGAALLAAGSAGYAAGAIGIGLLAASTLLAGALIFAGFAIVAYFAYQREQAC